jgi:hypothetical protein
MTEEQKQLVRDYQEVFKTDAGKRVFADLETNLNFNSSFEVAIQSGLPAYTGLQLGKREAFLYILDKITADTNVECQDNTQAIIEE